jgi:hypothetical protein
MIDVSLIRIGCMHVPSLCLIIVFLFLFCVSFLRHT